jgi:hypothetical protein
MTNAVILAASVAIVARAARRDRATGLLRSDALVEDMRQRQRHALELNDSIVQGLAAAKMSFEVGRDEDGLRMLEATLARARAIVTGLLGDGSSDATLRAGDVRRQTPVDVVSARP